MKYGILVTWEGPTSDKTVDKGFSEAVEYTIVSRLTAFNRSLKADKLSVLDFTIRAVGEADMRRALKKLTEQQL
jgi:hypothetical protein